MQAETKHCQNCKQNFRIETDDFKFYEKINVPPPTFCPECRLQRRLVFRNEKKLYKRKCNLTGKDIISVHSQNSPFVVYNTKDWFSDAWDAITYGRDYDFSKPFFQQLYNLMLVVPRMSLMIDYPTLINSDYTNLVGHLKNCYLISEADFDENCAYASSIKYSKDSFDILIGQNLELCYECINCRRCQRTYFSEDCEDCIDVYLSKDLVGCSNCFGCANLRKKQYHIFNKSYSRDDYFKRLEELQIHSRKSLAELQQKAFLLWNLMPKKYMHGRHNTNVTGDYIYFSKNSAHCNEAVGVEDSKYCDIISLKPVRGCYDYTEWGNNAELIYECLTAGEGASNIKFSNFCWPSVRDIEYSMFCRSSSNLFGCVGLHKKQFCIFNKQYTENDYWAMREKIISQMNEMPHTDNRGRVYRYGEFFPTELSPFAYNETSAQDFFPLTKKSALGQGHQWREPEEKSYEISRRVEDISDQIQDVPDSIVNDVLECEHKGACDHQCATAFKLIPQELQFYRNVKIPLPVLCPNCRHGKRIERRNPRKYWVRKCNCNGSASENNAYANSAPHFHATNHCPNEFETSYAPDRLEIIYCEECYQSETA